MCMFPWERMEMKRTHRINYINYKCTNIVTVEIEIIDRLKSMKEQHFLLLYLFHIKIYKYMRKIKLKNSIHRFKMHYAKI